MKWEREIYRDGHWYSLNGKWRVVRKKPREWTLYDRDDVAVAVRATLKECKELAESRE